MPESRKNVLVLGGTGAMGVSLIDILADKGWNVYVTSRKEHKSSRGDITYIKGNAKDNTFLNKVLVQNYDVIVDFMSYTTEEFKGRVKMLLSSTDQYLFLSSSRVYAQSDSPLTEESPRLLDVCTDKEYLSTDEYALAKARQEDILSSLDNQFGQYTIVRPSLTYSSNRLQLVISEKEEWLYRAINGMKIVLPPDIMDVQTSMARGADVAEGIAGLVGNEKAYGETYHIASPESRTWNEILEIYQNVIEEKTEKRMDVVYGPSALEIGDKLGRYYQIKYARGISRRFDSSKIYSAVSRLTFKTPEEGIMHCLEEFLNDPKFGIIQTKPQAYFDRITGERMNLKSMGSLKNRAKYLVFRYTPYFDMIG